MVSQAVKYWCPQADDAVFNNIVSATKELAVVKQAKKTSSQMMFHLVPKIASSLAPVASDGKSTEASEDSAASSDKGQKPMKTHELKKLRELETEAKARSKPDS